MMWYDRLVAERDDLQDKLFKLRAFLVDPTVEVDPRQLMLMHDQEVTMSLYLNILNKRVKLGE